MRSEEWGIGIADQSCAQAPSGAILLQCVSWFSRFYSIFKLHSGCDIGYFALGFAYTKYHNAHPRPDTSTLQPVPEPLVGFTKSQGLYVPASIQDAFYLSLKRGQFVA